MPLALDLQRLKDEYASREVRLAGDNRYSIFNPAYLFAVQQRQRSVLSALHVYGVNNLSNRSLLEVGCGSGGVLLEFLSYGIKPRNVYGIDLLPNRLIEAHDRLPYSKLICANGENLPYPGFYFDFVLQYTAFSSILDNEVKSNIAKEILRVLKPDGMVLWYDFWINPNNPQTRGIRPKEIQSLFPNCKIKFHKITLAPPITKRLVPISWSTATFLEELKLLNTHYLAVIQKA